MVHWADMTDCTLQMILKPVGGVPMKYLISIVAVLMAVLFLCASPVQAWPWTPAPKPVVPACGPVVAVPACTPAACLPAACTPATCATCDTATVCARRTPVRSLLKGVVERHDARVAARVAAREARRATTATCTACGPAACTPAACAPAACSPACPSCCGSAAAAPVGPAPAPPRAK